MKQSLIAEAVDRVARLYQSEPLSFAEMARVVGLDPSRDFRGADLRGADLSYEDLTAFDLRGADLRGANLTGAKFKLARLSGAHLREATIDNVLWVRPHWSTFASGDAWRVRSTRDADLLQVRQPHLREILANESTVVMSAPLSWLLDSLIILVIAPEQKIVRHAYFLYSNDELMPLGRAVWEEENQLRILGDINVTPQSALEYLAFELYFCAYEPWLIVRDIDHLEVFGTAGNAQSIQAATTYLQSLSAEPSFAPSGMRDTRFIVPVMSSGSVFPLSGHVSPRGEIDYDDGVVVSSEVPLAVIPPHEDAEAIFADWANRR